ncbi:Lipase member K [Tetrabaena socialis]|uniref:Lipase member K n=1 Tax=Tetrabaena socialis TaxID=47790 RepID=A0A2J8AAQ1_9CHLO|nr:Lipase member K [Tetrabaena socialis]|eukprot:PNH09594.1 Lipase member K [Tetrabaena socialis]
MPRRDLGSALCFVLASLGLAVARHPSATLHDDDPLERVAGEGRLIGARRQWLRQHMGGLGLHRPPPDPDVIPPGLVLPWGYPLEVHSVTTEDGFILTVLRIPHGRNATLLRARSSSNGDPARRPVVLLMHGLLDSAAGFLVNGPGQSLAFVLADAGYDVWLGNVRGNSLSRAHVSLDVADEAFWLWSYDEMASYDMPATVRHVLATAGAPSLRYVGYSQGTTVMLAALAGRAGPPPPGGGSGRQGGGGAAAERPGLLRGEEVERAVLLAPVALAKHIASVPLLALAALDTDDMFSLLGLHEFLPSQQLVAALEGRLCAAQPYLCVRGSAPAGLMRQCTAFTLRPGYNPANLDTDRLSQYFKFTPAGTSVQNMAHWAQAVRSRAPNSMSYFDYGINCASATGRCNQLAYGSIAPPRYNLTHIITPLALFSGTQDRLSTPTDVEYLLESLAPGVVRRSTVIPTYEHLDFIWGTDVNHALYDDVLRFLDGDGEGAGEERIAVAR